MAILTKKVSKSQREWLESFEAQTGFEVMRQEDLDGTMKTFMRVAQHNLRWFETHTSEAYLHLSGIILQQVSA